MNDETIALRSNDLTLRIPWVRFLPDHEREQFTCEFTEALQSCVSIGNFSKLDDLLCGWKSTALIYADQELATDLKRPIPAGLEIPVPRPRVPRTTESRFSAWKGKRVVSDPAILGGEPVFKGSRLSVRHIGGMPESERASILADYPYLTDEDISFAARLAKTEDTY